MAVIWKRGRWPTSTRDGGRAMWNQDGCGQEERCWSALFVREMRVNVVSIFRKITEGHVFLILILENATRVKLEQKSIINYNWLSKQSYSYLLSLQSISYPPRRYSVQASGNVHTLQLLFITWDPTHCYCSVGQYIPGTATLRHKEWVVATRPSCSYTLGTRRGLSNANNIDTDENYLKALFFL